jgi:S1-C subfamily serine protease
MFRKPAYLAVFVILSGVSLHVYAAPFLGVILGPAAEDTKGTAVVRVLDESPAAKAGLARGDIVQAVNDTEIADAESFVKAISALKAGDDVQLKIQRDGEEKTLTATLAEQPQRRLRIGTNRPIIGLAFQPPGESGKLVVAAVFPGGSAADAEIKPGDLLLEMDGHKIEGYEDLLQQMRDKKVGDEISLKIERDGETLDKQLKLKGFRPRQTDN